MIKHSERLDKVNPLLVQCANNISERVGKELKRDVIIVFGYRSSQQQDALFNQPWDKKDNDGDGKIDESDEMVTKAKSGQSAHEFYAAIDIWIMSQDNKTIDWNNKQFPTIIKEEVKKINGLTWGGDFKSIKDMPHIELTNWRNLRK